MIEPTETRYARTPDGGYIAYNSIGAGPVDIAFVGSLASQIEVMFEHEPFARFWAELASSARIVFHDRRGTGLSDAGAGLPNLETRVADLHAVLDAVGSSSHFLFGIADGGAACALYAATHPEQVAGFIWFAAEARALSAPDWPHGEPPEVWEQRVAGIADQWGTRDGVRRRFEDSSLPFDDALVRWQAKCQRSCCGPGTAEHFERLYAESDVRDVLPTLRVPTLVLDSEETGWGEASVATAALIPDAELRFLHGGPWLWDEAEKRADVIRGFLGVERPAPVLDRVLATVMFTDIVDSTMTASRIGDAEWHRLLDRHDRIADEVVERYRGHVVKSTGDGILARFDGPARAVFAAREISERVEPLGLRIRAGAHTGEIELSERDVAGIAVHVAARVAAKAGASEVWASSTVKDLTVGSGLTFEDAGEHELKGVPDRWRLYRVVA